MASPQGVYFYDYNIEVDDQQKEILDGLKSHPKRISPKYFYDQAGSSLFETITTLPEYYPTRCEIEILKNQRAAIKQSVGKSCVLIEYGSGASTKIRLLLDAIKPVAYVPLDISKDFLYESALALRRDFPWLEIHATCLDYRKPASIPKSIEYAGQKVAYFPGSSLGNFSPQEQASFLQGVRQTVGDQGALIIGLDRVKDTAVLNAAYNDKQGITAEFNRNILNHINQISDSQFEPSQFSHRAFFNDQHKRIEMHLVSELDQMVQIYGERILFKKGETITTEYSYKFSDEGFVEFAREYGFECENIWQDEKQYFSLFYLRAI